MSVSPPPVKRRKLSPSKASRIIDQESPNSAILPPAATITALAKSSPLRVFSWNINGVNNFLPTTNQKILYYLKHPPDPPRENTIPNEVTAGFPSLRKCFQRWQWPHIICLQEVKIPRSDSETQLRLKRIVNKQIDDTDDVTLKSRLYTPHFSLPRDKYNATGFGGKVHGVCTLLRQDLQFVKVKEADWDLEGRVLITELPAHSLVVINVYCVNGTEARYRSPTTGAVTGTRHTRKRAFHSDLRDQVLAYEKAGWEVLVIGDINVARSEIDSHPKLRAATVHQGNRLDFEEKLIRRGGAEDGAGMTDVFRFMKMEEKKYTYRPTTKSWGEGMDRVDMALVTQGLMDRVQETDILDTEEERGPSDHVPLFVEIGEEEGASEKKNEEES